MKPIYSKLFLALPIYGIFLVLLTPYPNVYATSIVGNYAEGYEVGKDAGADDRFDGKIHDSKCPPNDSLSWCTGYKIGYEVGWSAAGALR